MMDPIVHYLPLELLCNILSYLPIRNIFKVQTVSKEFASAVTDKYLWCLCVADYSFDSITQSLKLARNITLSLQQPTKIFDCNSTKIIITTKNHVLFDDPDPNSILFCKKYNIYNGNETIDINKERMHIVDFNGDYYRDITNGTIINLYTGKICDHDYAKRLDIVVGTDNDVLLTYYRNNSDNKLVISGFNVDKDLIYETIFDPLSQQFIIKKDRNFILFDYIFDVDRHIEVYDINAKSNIYNKSMATRGSAVFGRGVRFNYPFLILVKVDENKLNKTINVEVLNLKTDDIKIIYEIAMSRNFNTTNFKFALSKVINGNLFFNFHDSDEPNTLFHYNLYIEEYLGKYQMGSKLAAFDINENILATCQNNSIQVYNLC